MKEAYELDRQVGEGGRGESDKGENRVENVNVGLGKG